MSTRCLIHFCRGKDTDGSWNVSATIYRHNDGYPEGVKPDLKQFFIDVDAQTDDRRFGDASYLAAKFVVWQANENNEIETKYLQAGAKNGRLNFISLGIVPTNIAPKDIGAEYEYYVDCSKKDAQGRPKVTHKSVKY